MKKQLLILIWITLGITLIVIGFGAFFKYCQKGILWLIVIPEIYSFKNIIWGIIAIIISKCVISNKIIINLLVYYSFSIIVFIISTTIYNLFNFNNVCSIFYLIPDFLLLILIMITFKFYLKNKIIGSKKELFFIYKKDLIKKIIMAFLSFGIIVSLSIIFSYEFFKY
jgi:hypothetical protein